MAREAQKKVEPALKLYGRDPKGASMGPEIGSYESVADLLRRTREQYGEDLRSVAEALRIRYVHLLAIEEGRFRDLPGSTYALGFVRSYAEFLGLDGPEIVERFKDEVAELNRKTQLVFPTPVPEGKVPGGALILISVILLGAAYGAWSYLSRPGVTIADLIPPVPEHLQSLSGESAEGPGETRAAGPSNGTASEPSVTSPTQEAARGERRTAAVPADRPAATAAAPEDPAESGVESATGTSAAGAIAVETPAPGDDAAAPNQVVVAGGVLPDSGQGAA
ncbi:MAG: helix-turn-helix domain-containing protein, partial [Kiloniellales bacterium]